MQLNQPTSEKLTAPQNDYLAQTTLATVVRAIAKTLDVQYGIDPLPIFQRIGIEFDHINGNELRLPVTTLSILWQRCAESSGDEAFGLRVAAHTGAVNLYGIDLALYASQTFGESIRRHVEFVRVLSTVAMPTLHTAPNGDHLLQVHIHGPHVPPEVARDYFVALHLRIFQRQIGLPLCHLLRRLELRRPAPHDPTPWEELGVPVFFGQPLGTFVFKAGAWDLDLKGANQHLLAQVEQPILHQLIRLGLPLPACALRRRLADMLPCSPNLETLADAIGLAPDQLQASLRYQKLSFAKLLDQAREAQALHLLLDPTLTLEQIANRTGFSKPSGFNRAFRRWRAITPLSYRNQMTRTHDPL